MSDRTLRRQDEATAVGIFEDGHLVRVVPDGVEAYDLRDQLADERGVPRGRYEVLKQCPEHPNVSAVDCLDCDPE